MHVTNASPLSSAITAVAINNTPATIKYLQGIRPFPFGDLKNRCVRGALLLMHAGVVQKLFFETDQPMPAINFPKSLFLLALGSSAMAIVTQPIIQAVQQIGIAGA